MMFSGTQAPFYFSCSWAQPSRDVLGHMPLNPVGKIDKLTLRREMPQRTDA